MRDLIRNYKLIIKGKHLPDSDSETLVSSTSSPGFTTSTEIGEPRIFSQDHCSTDSEGDIQEEKSPEKPTVGKPQKSSRKSSTKDRNMQKGDYFYDIPPCLNQTITEKTKLLGSTNDSLHSLNSLKPDHKQTNSSMITIFAVWNTTVGTSLLAMAWGMEKAGLFPGIIINLLVVGVCLYTAYILLKMNEKHGVVEEDFEVPELCRLLIGQWAEIISKVFSLIVLIGSDIVYWILLSNFMYNFVVFIYGYYHHAGDIIEDNVICPNRRMFINTTDLVQSSTLAPTIPMSDTFARVWDLYSTVPLFLGLMMFPLLNIKSPTFFTKFNSLGTLSVTYLIIFVAVKSFGWGVNVDDWSVEFNLKSSFCVLSGMLTLSYFIHNIIISIMRHNKHPEQNGRDLTIAFGLVTFTYLFLGIAFYVSFPLQKSCIQDNLLNNFSKTDIMALIARVLLFFQLFTVFPFVTYMLRNDILTCINMICGKARLGDFSYWKTILINLSIVTVCIMFACFLPRIGTLIRYTGALSGLIYIFIMPSLLKMASLKKEGSLTFTSKVMHTGIMILGVLNLVSQFFITE